MTPEAVGLSRYEYDQLVSQLGRVPEDLELALVGALWSEHCSYKSSKAALAWLAPRAGVGSSVAAGPGDNAGAVRFSDRLDIVFKVESHNHPSFVEPFSGAATGVGGIIRDVLAMGAEPIALLDSLRFGTARQGDRVSRGVVSGIAAYGNAVGVPTVGGEVAYGPGYEWNPLVNVMCVGRRSAAGRVNAQGAEPGDHLLLLGAATGPDGIGGASLLASREFHPGQDDQRPMVQVGDPFTGKLLIEAVLAALETGRVHAVQDLGASGLSSAVAELASQSGAGAEVDVARVALREPNLSAADIMLSESQERMLLAVAEKDVDAVARVIARWELTAWDIGRMTDTGCLTVSRGPQVLGSLPVRLLTDGVPKIAAVRPARPPAPPPWELAMASVDGASLKHMLLAVLGHEAVASHRDVYRQYDSMVKANTVVGPGADAAVVRLAGERAGLAVTIDGQARWGAVNAWTGGSRAVLEAVLNLAVTGAEPLALSDGLNAASPQDPAAYQQLLALIAGVAEAAHELAVPITGGNVSLYNQTEHDGRVDAIWPTAVIGAVGRHPRLDQITPVGLPGASATLFRLGPSVGDLAASVWRLASGDGGVGPACPPDWAVVRRVLEVLRRGHERGWFAAAHDVSDGGTAAAVCEMLLLSLEPSMAVRLDLAALPPAQLVPYLFGEDPGVVVVAVHSDQVEHMRSALVELDVPAQVLGEVVDGSGELACHTRDGMVVWPRAALVSAWHRQGEGR